MLRIERIFELSVSEVEEKLKTQLEKRGLKAIMELTPSDVVKDKLDKDIPTYRILYICNPKDFYNMLEKAYDVGSFAPCPVVIYEKDGKTHLVVNVCDEVVDILKEPLERAKEAIMAI